MSTEQESTPTQPSVSTQPQMPAPKPHSSLLKIGGIILGALALVAVGGLIGWLLTGRFFPAYGINSMMRNGAVPFQADRPYGPGGMMGGQFERRGYGPGMMGGQFERRGYGPGGMMGGDYDGRGYGPGGMMGGFGPGDGPMSEYHDLMIKTLAGELGLSAADLQAGLDDGKTIWQIADEQGISDEDLLAAMQTARAVMVGQALSDGVITQEQADWMLSHEPGDCPHWDAGNNN